MTPFRSFSKAIVCFLAILLLLEDTQCFPRKKSSIKTRGGKKSLKARPILASIGANCKLKCATKSKNAVVIWYFNGKPLNATQHPSKYKLVRHRRKEILQVATVTLLDSGTYSCEARPGKSVAWRIVVKSGKKGRCRRSNPEIPKDPCRDNKKKDPTSNCYSIQANFKNCSSFAGVPRKIIVGHYLDKIFRSPVIVVNWKEPKIGNRDLWGYEVRLIGHQSNNANFLCRQINSKRGTSWAFYEGIKYGTNYTVKLRSLPSNIFYVKSIAIKRKCEYKEYQFEAICCKLHMMNMTLIEKEGMIELKWRVECPNKNITLRRFQIFGHNLQYPKGNCDLRIEPDFNVPTGNKIYNYTIHIKRGQCRRFNYTITLFGLGGNNTRTDQGVKLLVDFPEKPIKVTSISVISKIDESTNKIIVAVVGVLFGVILVVFFLVYRFCFSKVVLKLPNCAYQPTNDGGNDGNLLEGNAYPKRIFLMYARCCQRCNWVVHCLGELLRATNAVEPVCDMWHEAEIAAHPVRWYGGQVSQADCVIVLASNKMSLSYNHGENTAEDANDLLSIQSQLNFVSGELAITQNPDSPKFITAYFSYNGDRCDVPQFLNSRLPYKLTKDLDRLIFHILNVEAIQPQRTRPIAILGGTQEFNTKRSLLLQAVNDAKQHHFYQDANNIST